MIDKGSKQVLLGVEIDITSEKLPMVLKTNKSPSASTKGDAIRRFHEFNMNMETQMEILHRKLNGIKKRVKLNTTNNNANGFIQNSQYGTIAAKQALNAGSRSVHF